MLTKKQKEFCEQYLQSGNSYQSAIKVGYSESIAMNVKNKVLSKAEVSAYIEERRQKMANERIATTDEIWEKLTSIMRGENTGTEYAVVFDGNGKQKVQLFEKTPNQKEILDATKTLAKLSGLEVERLKVDNEVSVKWDSIDGDLSR